MSEKKMIRRNVLFALGIICAALAIGLVAPFEYYSSTINDKDKVIATQASQIESLTSILSDLQSQLGPLNHTVNDLTSIVNLNETWHWSGGELRQYNASSYDEWASNPNYAGYIRVDVNSNATSTYVRVFYYSYSGVNYDNQVVVGTGITHTFFPVLPTNEITIRVGNTNSFDGALIGVTITYYTKPTLFFQLEPCRRESSN